MTTDWEVLVPMEIDPVGPESIADFATCTGMAEYGSHEAALEDIDRYDAAVVRVAQFDESVIERADNLKVISKHGSGLDNVDIDAASNRGIVVCNTPGANARAVAEHAVALTFGLARNLRTGDRHVRSGGWDRSAFTGMELRGKTLGIYGFGSIGREVREIAEGIGLSVSVYDPHKAEGALPDSVTRAETLPGLFERSDVVSVHAPLTEETSGSVSAEELRALGPDGLVINTARGAIIDEEALVDALDAGRIGGAGLDTFADEPPASDHPLFDRDDVLVSPHVGANSHAALREMSLRSTGNVRTVYEGGLPESTVNADRLTRTGE
ncbi:hydroxyacid dehydrogenase [Halovenus sp. WSH3]|uniref:Hydroxyacid dehydrogenase n=1 Tax=Halovenus carboxidivorans TaxID=2692199 RepID=A0A6B0SZQ3_9EURY|nr:hydroxyacid dehydrogenase [Halovenus carboxidivorans]MXR51005.1 hydroxyacid dehydrogenase [Halovenus carboxidivorans]